ncbi:hypothetical protein BGZ65_004887 [Modicella reniformis]|uniref:Arrestin-like N-terminal domain-containing protein n=1 Tax=Modicella reniformis TaxID=1440133 RepID=A0A9P6MBF7_9FUNG|nr:hypothetical protein BGZ65_004887 [Modicella reniformis]
MTATMRIEFDDSYLVLPYLRPGQQHGSELSNNDTPIVNSPASSMAMTSPERTLSFGATSIASTIPSSSASVCSSFEVEQGPTSVSTSGTTTTLKGRLILSLTKPTKVASLAITLNGSTHIAFLGGGKRAHYSRHHIRSQQFLIEPRPQSDQYTLLSKDTISYPFSIEVPNHLPPSVTTHQGGTIYRLTAVLTLAKNAGIMSFLSSSTTLTTSSTIQIYRAPRSRCLLLEAGLATDTEGESEEDEDEETRLNQEPGESHTEQREPIDENDMMPAVVHHTWPGQLEAKISIPYTQLPPQSKPDLHLRVRVLRDKLAIKSFQAALWERAIFRIQKAGATGKKHIIGVRERIVSAQRCDAGWVNETITSQVPHTFEKVVLFSIPSAFRSHNEQYASRSCNASTYTKDSEFGEIHIEIQHFIRYSLFVIGSVDSKGKTILTPVERKIGDVPVIVRAVPMGPECDRTGLPTYMHSFSTSRVSYEEAHDYELEATGMGAAGDAGEIVYDGTSALGPIYGDYEDDAFMALMGYRGNHTPPSYEESVGRPSVDVSIFELQNLHLSNPQEGMETTNTITDRTNNYSSSSVLGLTR